MALSPIWASSFVWYLGQVGSYTPIQTLTWKYGSWKEGRRLCQILFCLHVEFSTHSDKCLNRVTWQLAAYKAKTKQYFHPGTWNTNQYGKDVNVTVENFWMFIVATYKWKVKVRIRLSISEMLKMCSSKGEAFAICGSWGIVSTILYCINHNCLGSLSIIYKPQWLCSHNRLIPNQANNARFHTRYEFRENASKSWAVPEKQLC